MKVGFLIAVLQMEVQATIYTRREKTIILAFKKNIFYSLNLLVDNDANSMLGYIVDSASFAVVALMGHSLLNGTCALE